jgi:hypothetical protein
MGLIYTKTYIDFSESEWKQTSNNPATFEAIIDNATLDIMDDGYKTVKVTLKKGGKIKYIRSIGKYRLSWDDKDAI